MSEQEIPMVTPEIDKTKPKICIWCKLPIEGEVKFWMLAAKQVTLCVKCYNKVLSGLDNGQKK